MGHRAPAPPKPWRPSIAQRGILMEAVAGVPGLRNGYVHVRDSAPIQAAERLVRRGLLTLHGGAFTGGRVYEITADGRKAVAS